tara:strand:- start:269 stop:451 length:183 start_codon:yes stop_codon:yes gene_type:complete
MAKVKFTRREWTYICEALRCQAEGFYTEDGEDVVGGCEGLVKRTGKIQNKIDLILKTNLK